MAAPVSSTIVPLIVPGDCRASGFEVCGQAPAAQRRSATARLIRIAPRVVYPDDTCRTAKIFEGRPNPRAAQRLE